MDPVLADVRQRMEAAGLTYRAAAGLIGISPGALERHLSGGYARSDSLAKYRRWLRGIPTSTESQQGTPSPDSSDTASETEERLSQIRLSERPAGGGARHLVVDLFSGCGGLSLGFDLLHGNKVFETILAMDIEEPLVRSFNENAPEGAAVQGESCRRVDLSNFINEAEILAFYLDHVAHRLRDTDLERQLDRLPVMGLQLFKQCITNIDEAYLRRLLEIRDSSDFVSDYSRLDSTVLRQTSVMGFYESLGIPIPSSGRHTLGPLVWAGGSERKAPNISPGKITGKRGFQRLRSLVTERLEQFWMRQFDMLRGKAKGRGPGQLASSATRITAFLGFLDTAAMAAIRTLWLDWRSTRDTLRLEMFSGQETFELLRSAYTEKYEVSVLLGGPPCQGFSRIGRGKIRSLRDHQVHVQYDPGAGDQRNRLLSAYVLFVSALAPKAFLFENVRHFQATVRTPDGTFLASDVLADAIRDISDERLSYRVASRILDASRHLVPQTRERYFMAGIRSDLTSGGQIGDDDTPSWCLALKAYEQIPISAALDGLPDPHAVNGHGGPGGRLAREVQTALAANSSSSPSGTYTTWIGQPPRASINYPSPPVVDAHVIRPPRLDDEEFFRMLGPGKRWMDYRCDRSETVRDLGEVLNTLRKAVAEAHAGERGDDHPALQTLRSVDTRELEELAKVLDGSLALRLLLEGVEPISGELRHHLITPKYLAKRAGNHGDWLARLDPDLPSKTILSHMAKDTYAYVHPLKPRTLSVREAARIQTFPDWFRFGTLSFVDAFRAIGNAVPPLLSHQLAERIAQILWVQESSQERRPSDQQSYRARV